MNLKHWKLSGGQLEGEHLVAIVFGLCFVILSFRGFVFSFFFVRDFYCSFGLFLKACFLVMKASSTCDKDCALHDH